MRIFVNRRDEMSGVDKLVRDNAYGRRVAIFHAVDGMGKTSLLTEMYERYKLHTATALIDLGKPLELFDLLDEIANQFADQGVAIPLYRSRARKPVDIRLENIKAKDSPITIAIAARQRADGLLCDLLDDLEGAPGPLRRLVLIDRCEAAGEPMRDWLSVSFIPKLLYRSATICVLAGCHELELSYPHEKRTDRLPLPALDETAIDQWLSAAGITRYNEDAHIIWAGTGGIPDDVARFIFKLIETERRGKYS